jgi:hypothetical protein
VALHPGDRLDEIWLQLGRLGARPGAVGRGRDPVPSQVVTR